MRRQTKKPPGLFQPDGLFLCLLSSLARLLRNNSNIINNYSHPFPLTSYLALSIGLRGKYVLFYEISYFKFT